ncbi:MAG TPA: uroporphyrinogen-III C-methyltransferase [Candidatus Solibacter sp.]|jgi:uroporphyrin-III C-methyltransferase|nr:uroporphyrinogen-III C-methyltransferase [Candidatus Solibacter sp.]
MPQHPGNKPPELSIRRARPIRVPSAGDPRVYLVGAGPGDPELLTVRAARLLEAADFVFHDALVPQAILDRVREGAEMVAVGHRAGGAKPSVEPAAKEMARQALAGNVVVRLKGGDPFLFGRGGEEAQALLDAGVAFEVVPGVSSALAGPAAAGIPVTHRRLAASVTIVTGHECEGELERVRWDALATASDTLVVLMGAGRLTQLSRRIIAAGRPPATPAAVVMAASRPEQRQALATLADIAQAARAAGIGAPAILVVGEVVALAQSLGRQGIEQLGAEVAAL